VFTRISVPLVQNPTCSKSLVFTPTAKDFRYYDKDGFELCQAEQRYYEAENHPIEQPILNHRLWQEEWLTIDHPTLHLDHAMILHRCSFEDDAQEQLFKLKKTIPQADLLLRTRQQWGYDFDLDAIGPNGEIFEVLHVEMDFNDFAQFESKLYQFEDEIDSIDWGSAADKIWAMKDHWSHLKGFAQNDWKANYLLGQKKSEYTEKAI
jgi:hypothetical protein